MNEYVYAQTVRASGSRPWDWISFKVQKMNVMDCVMIKKTLKKKTWGKEEKSCATKKCIHIFDFCFHISAEDLIYKLSVVEWRAMSRGEVTHLTWDKEPQQDSAVE